MDSFAFADIPWFVVGRDTVSVDDAGRILIRDDLAVATVRHGGKEGAVAITQEDLVLRYLADHGQESDLPVRPGTRLALANFLMDLANRGFEYIAIDPFPVPVMVPLAAAFDSASRKPTEGGK